MIAVDTSALIAVVRREDTASACAAALYAADHLLISAATLVEVAIVAMRREVTSQTNVLLQTLRPEVVPVDEEAATRIQLIYKKWGKSFHQANLNFGDCFAYDVARQHDCPLLYVGNDFAQTDIRSAL